MKSTTNNTVYIFCRFAESLADFRANPNAVKLATAFALLRLLRINDEACWGENI